MIQTLFEWLNNACSKVIANSWVELVSCIITIIAGLFGLFRGICLFSKSNEIKRAELLKSLLDDYNGKIVSESIKAIDEGKLAYSNDSFVMPQKINQQIHAADPALLFLSNVCYLHKNKLINEREFSFFEPKIKQILGDTSLSKYIKDCISRDINTPYKLLQEVLN